LSQERDKFHPIDFSAEPHRIASGSKYSYGTKTMNAIFSQPNLPPTHNVRGLVDAVAHNTVEDSLGKALTPLQWEAMAPFLQPFSLAQSQMLIAQGSLDRTLYFLESGSLSVHYEDEAGRVHLAIVQAGNAVGEGGFFSQMPRNATVQAVSDCKLWNLTYLRFVDMSQKLPRVALALSLALGAIISKRMVDRRKRVSVT
jgi:CRP/FNR family transcriptional regulator, cyclic AMP receptor protein